MGVAVLPRAGLRWVDVALVLLAGVLAAVVSVWLDVVQAVGIFGAVLVGLGILSRPQFGPYGLLLVVGVAPHSGVLGILGYMLTPVDLFMIPFALSWVIHKGLTGKGIRKDPLLIPIALVVFVRFLSIFAMPSLVAGASIAFLRYLEWLLVFLTVVDLCGRRDAQRLVALFLLIVGVQSVISVVQFVVSLLGTEGAYASRGGTLGPVGSMLAWLQVYAILISRSLMSYSPLRARRKWWWLYQGVVFIGLLTMLARSAWLALLLGLLCFELLDPRVSLKVKMVRVGALVGSVLVILGPLFLWGNLFSTTIRARLESIANLGHHSSVERFALWQSGIRMFLQHPFLGVGPGNFVDLLPDFYPGEVLTAHNAVVNILAESGLLGLFTYLLFTGSVVVMVGSDVRRLRESDVHPLLLALGSGVFAMLLADWFSWTSFFPWSMLFLSIYVALRKGRRRHET